VRQQNKLSRSGRPTGHADMTRVLCTPQQLSRVLVGKVENGLGTTIFIYVVHIDLIIYLNLLNVVTLYLPIPMSLVTFEIGNQLNFT
jgi:hypothetical protein